MAFSFAIFSVPKASTIVTMELNASGIAATASATANINAFNILSSLYISNTNTIIHMVIIIIANFPLNLSKVFCNGVSFAWVFSIKFAIFPNSEFIPVEVTTAIARP